MKNHTYKIILSFIALILSCSSCKKFVEIPPPSTQLVPGNVFNNNSSATGALTAIYTQMMINQESFFMSSFNGILSDEMTNYSTDPGEVQLYTNAMSATQTPAPGPWTNAYNYIYQCNAIIEGLEKTTGVSNSVKQQLIGESEFTRAFWHFYLTNIYGDVPLVLTTDYKANATISRTPRLQVLQQVISDLKNSYNLLNPNYIDASDTTITTEKVRPNKGAAAALLARAYLYLGNYSNDAANFTIAESQASLVLNNSNLYSLCSDLNKVFLPNSTEAIWQLAIPLPASNGNAATPDGASFILIAEPGTAGVSVTLSPQLLNTFETGDNRKIDWVGSFAGSTTTYYFPYKYKVQNSSDVSEYEMVIRLGELYLIRAEARTQLGNISGALSDLNTIRLRAGLGNYNGATDKTSLLSAILHERQVELFSEWGHRWFDLIRTGNVNSVMNVVTPVKGGTWGSNGQQTLYPIPQSEINKDSKLSQNPGY